MSEEFTPDFTAEEVREANEEAREPKVLVFRKSKAKRERQEDGSWIVHEGVDPAAMFSAWRQQYKRGSGEVRREAVRLVAAAFMVEEATAQKMLKIEDWERREAKKRQKTNPMGGKAKPRLASGKLPEANGQARDKVGAAVGLSGRSYEKAKAVMKAATAEPEKFGKSPRTWTTTGRTGLEETLRALTRTGPLPSF